MNVIWIIADTLRRDYMGAYGNKMIHTPSLDALAAKSVRFDNHYAASFPTMPARADFLTGRWTMSFMKWAPLPKEEIVLGELLASQGVHTSAFVDTPFYIRNAMGYDRGFRTFTEIPGQLHHLAADNQAMLPKVGRAAAVQRVDHLPHLQRIANGCAQRLVHIRQHRRHVTADALANFDHQPGHNEGGMADGCG